MFINHNGNILPADQPIFTAGNRAFRYGDGLFETIRVFDGRMPFFERHWQRLSRGCRLLSFELPTNFTPTFFKQEIEKLTNAAGNWRVRLSIWRGDGGFYTPETNLPEFLVEPTPLLSPTFELNEVGLSVGFYQKYLLPQTTPSYAPNGPSVPLPIKTSSALHQVLAAIAKTAAGLDDCLMLNTARRVACATSSNVFLVKNGELFTPPLTEGCVAGTMRAVLFDMVGKLGIPCNETPVVPKDFKDFDEIFLTNAIHGIRWVGEVEGFSNRCGNSVAMVLLDGLNEVIG
ncbi:MAG: aminotransferase class IV [Saprospiraceae bacterium]|nr:aminotransferase class IV [Saprospiraceae bacterium]MCF8249941.1 aminotransferase class IV [Saprospiraceae bacterium]MCF8279354.1 aminotransferase class IV [Bacteroidales bacterium]MCF8310045.1 aminotransferase class IV [Saprospiraceae bacterium]MCF8438945.1 aminotransferase class IV [Saprospiraceae bacterium]